MNLTRSAPRFAATGPLGPRGSRHDPARWSDALALFGLLLDNERELHQRVALAVRMHAAKVERLLPEYALALALRAPTEHPLLAYLHAYLTLTPAQARAVRKKTVRLPEIEG